MWRCVPSIAPGATVTWWKNTISPPISRCSSQRICTMLRSLRLGLSWSIIGFWYVTGATSRAFSMKNPRWKSSR